MKTKIEQLNFNDLAFFKGISTTDAKFEIAEILWGLDDTEFTKSGTPKVKVGDTIPVNKIDFTMRSNSKLEGKSQLDYLVNHYNKGTTISNLYKFSETMGFIKALKFTGKYSILNDILNREQLLKLQKTWLLKRGILIDKTSYSFLQKHKWAKPLLQESRSNVDIDERIKLYLKHNNKK